VAEVKTEKDVTAMISSACYNSEADGTSTLAPKATRDNGYAPPGKLLGVRTNSNNWFLRKVARDRSRSNRRYAREFMWNVHKLILERQ
jgi:hypothetical protein